MIYRTHSYSNDPLAILDGDPKWWGEAGVTLNSY